jgi:DNA polymerase V
MSMKSNTIEFKPSNPAKTSAAPTFLGRAVIDPETRAEFPLVLHNAPAGFPSPADDYIENTLDLNEYLIDNPVATFMMRVSGNSMLGAGINDKDVIIVDRSKEALPGKIVVAVLDGELTVKRLEKSKNGYVLVPENPDFQPIMVEDEQELVIWGVVTGIVRRF